MKIDPNDPRLTAYALGELDDADRAAVEALLKDDESARHEVEIIRRAASFVTDELQSEPCPRLHPEQLVAIRERLAPNEKQTPVSPWWKSLGWITALSATAVVIAVLFLPAINGRREKPIQLAQQTPMDREATPWTAPQGVPAPTSQAVSPPETHAVTIAASEASATGSAVKPGDHVDVLETVTDPGSKSQSTRIVLKNVPVLDQANGQLTLGTTANQARSLTAADRAGTLRVLVRPQAKFTALTAQAQPSGAALNQTAVNEQSVVLLNSPAARQDLGANAQSYDAHSTFWDDSQVQPPEGQPATGITIYQGTQSRVVPLRSSISMRPKDSGGNLIENDGHVEWQQTFPNTLPQPPYPTPNAESYAHSVENAFVTVTQNPLSTFSLDVDTASYANVRRFLNQGTLPPRDAVRIEEMLNYFPYDYPAPSRGEPFALYVEMAECPWNSAHRLALVALKAQDVAQRAVQPMNLVFLIDVSGSMADENKLPLVKQSLRLLVERLTARDRVAIVVYAGDSRVALPSTSGDNKDAILAVIDSLEAGGSTNGGAGIQSAYQQAVANFIEGGVNRVILCTDGDFNVGITDPNQLVQMVQQQSHSSVFLTILGVGMGNLKDSTMQKLADKGHGNYAYIDTLDEANKVLVEQMHGTLVTVAKDAKVQIEFNPALVQSYRLIGYEKRMLRARDFNNDRRRAGDVGAGHTVTALYEIVPNGAPSTPGVDPLKYQPAPQPAFGDELMTVKLRYKDPEGSTSHLLTAPVKDQHTAWRGTSPDFRFAASVAAFGLTLRDSPYKGAANLDLALELAQGAQGRDVNGYRSEFISLVNQARALHSSVVPGDP